ncbi:MAG: aminopeptidase [Candidatus Tectomicrobia bacterium]|uniref:Aminopeptidase N n=1 Tax=Tectimicrobiota bacterium TaxID=2528274 RepID=A0A938AZ78_UNCTE|nr:aminopeptidase [Candidatus Tectomicrobia bacterium]
MHELYCRRGWEASAEQARRGRRAYALAEAKPHFAADRPCDVAHIALKISLDIAQQTVQGTCATTVRALQETVEHLTLDAVDLQIEQVRCSDGAILPYTYDGQQLRVTFAEPLAQDMSTTVEVEYQVTKPRLGLYFITPDAAYPEKAVQVWTQCQDEDARYWFPCFDAPHEKATTAMTVTVPQPYFVLSNGALLSTTRDEAAGTITYHWVHDQPHSTYLMTLVAGEFSEQTELVDGIPVQWYVTPGREEDGQRAFGDTPAMLRFFSDKLKVPYPWNKYAQVAVSDFIFGGMENTTATTQTDLTLHDARAHLDFSSNGLVAHELAHQWFGNLLTCKHWSHAWLNEGFATYFDALFHEHHRGTDEFRYYMHQNARAYFREDAEVYRRPIVTNVYQEPIDLFDHHLYEKGSLVLHMLRYTLGETAFWHALTHYITAHRHQVVETVDLERAIEAATGRNLQAFFQQWVYQGGYPEYQVEFAWDEAASMATVTVRQQQKTGTEHGVETPLFDMPVTILFALPEGEQRLSQRIHEQLHTFHMILPAKPRWFSFDPGNWILKKLKLQVPKDMLMTQLQHDPEIMGRIYAAEALGELGNLEAVESLRQALAQDAFWGVQAEVARVLGSIHTPAALAALLAQTQLSHPKARRAVMTALGEFKDDQAAAALRATLQAGDASYFVEAEAAAALGKTRRDSALAPLQQAALKPSWNETVRNGVFRGLADLRDESVIPLLQDFTAYGQPPLARAAAIRALGALGGEKEPAPAAIVDTLTTLLDEEHFRIRMAVLDALASLHNPKTLPALERLRSRDLLDGRIKRRVEEVIEGIRSERKQTDEVQQLRDDFQALRETNKQLLERLDRLEARPSSGAHA